MRHPSRLAWRSVSGATLGAQIQPQTTRVRSASRRAPRPLRRQPRVVLQVEDVIAHEEVTDRLPPPHEHRQERPAREQAQDPRRQLVQIELVESDTSAAERKQRSDEATLAARA